MNLPVIPCDISKRSVLGIIIMVAIDTEPKINDYNQHGFAQIIDAKPTTKKLGL